MATSILTVPAGDHGHICALVDGPEDAYRLILPFIAEGFARAERAVHLVDPAQRKAHIERLAASGIDVDATTMSRQLEVQTWTESYLRGGQFDRAAHLARLMQTLGEGPRLGYPVTRLIGMMDWAVDSEVLGDLLGYEARLDELLRRRPDIVVCVYDLLRHDARAIADVLAYHPGPNAGDFLRADPGRATGSARHRLLTAASQLFHETGIQATGVDSIIATAAVAKATFYRQFPSKADLVVAWLRSPRARWFDGVRRQAEARASDAEEVIPQLFDALAEWLEREDFRGCAYLNTSAEITDPRHPAHVVVRDYLQEIEDDLADMLSAAGYQDPRGLAAQLQTIVAGSISLATARRSVAKLPSSRAAALELLHRAERAPDVRSRPLVPVGSAAQPHRNRGGVAIEGEPA